MRNIIILFIASLFLGFFSFVVLGRISSSLLLSKVDTILGVGQKNDSSPNNENTGDPTCKDCNVILITLTNLRYDHLSQNGYFRPTTPVLDALAEESLVFDNTFSHSSWTLPEGISIYTSLYPYQHGVMDRYGGGVLPQDTLTLVDVMNDNGYTTSAFTGGFDYDPVFGLTNRFGEFELCKRGGDGGEGQEVQRYGELTCTIPRAVEWLKNNFSTKFFMHVQGFDAHCPFSQEGGYMYDKDYGGTVDYSKCLWTFGRSEPQTIDGKTYYPVYSPRSEGKASILLGEEDVNHLIALYDESITVSDKLIGSFLEEIEKLGLNDNTIIIFTSEHGDMFGKHGRFMRGGPLRGTFYDDVLHVPFFIKHPKIKPARLDGLVEQIDIAPTLLDFLAIPQEPSFQGKSIVPLIMDAEEIHEYVFAGSEYSPREDNIYFHENTRTEAIRSKKWKLVRETVLGENTASSTEGVPVSSVELYDMINDKEELHNLAPAIEEKLSKSKRLLWRLGLGPIFLSEEERILIDLQSRLSSWSEKIRGE